MKKTVIILALLVIFTILSCKNSDTTSNGTVKSNDTLNIDSSVRVIAPNESSNGKIVGNLGGCGYDTTPPQSTITLYEPRPREISQINSILKFSGLSSNFKIYAANIKNAVATIVDNKRYILYDPNLLSYSDEHSGNYWSSMSILAHEIGHHLSGHTLTNKGSNPHDELEADKYSGFVLYKLGATLPQALTAINELGSEYASLTHPAKKERIQAITDGWNEANSTRYNSAIPPPPNDNPKGLCVYTSTMLIDKENIVNDKDGNAYGKPQFLYGIIIDVEKDLSRIKVHVVKTSTEFAEDFRSIDGENWDVTIDNSNWGGKSDMGHACSLNFPSFFVPGRRLKFAMVEGYPGCGTSEAGNWHLTYAEALEGSSF